MTLDVALVMVEAGLSTNTRGCVDIDHVALFTCERLRGEVLRHPYEDRRYDPVRGELEGW